MLTHFSCFTAENTNSNAAVEYDVFNPFRGKRHSLDVPRGALVLLVAILAERGEYHAHGFVSIYTLEIHKGGYS